MVELVACPNEGGVCATPECGATECPLWYGKKPNKICTPCYRQAKKKADQAARAARSPATGRPARREAKVFGIEAIYGCRNFAPPACLHAACSQARPTRALACRARAGMWTTGSTT